MTFNLHKLETYLFNDNESKDLFCLLDGAQLDHEKNIDIEYIYGSPLYLFKGTYEADAYKYGPILLNLSVLDKEQLASLKELMNTKDSMIFIKSHLDIQKLKNRLLENLYLKFDDGSVGILRFYDPRVLKRFSQIMTNEQKYQFMDGIETIYFVLNNMSYEIKNHD
jgi:hypothetical protein